MELILCLQKSWNRKSIQSGQTGWINSRMLIAMGSNGGGPGAAKNSTEEFNKHQH